MILRMLSPTEVEAVMVTTRTSSLYRTVEVEGYYKRKTVFDRQGKEAVQYIHVKAAKAADIGNNRCSKGEKEFDVGDPEARLRVTCC